MYTQPTPQQVKLHFSDDDLSKLQYAVNVLSGYRRILQIENNEHVIMMLAHLLTYEYVRLPIINQHASFGWSQPTHEALWSVAENSPYLIAFWNSMVVHERRPASIRKHPGGAVIQIIPGGVMIRTNLDPYYVELLRKFVRQADYFDLTLIMPSSIRMVPFAAPAAWTPCLSPEDSQIAKLTLTKNDISRLDIIFEKCIKTKLYRKLDNIIHILTLIALILTFNRWQQDSKINPTIEQILGSTHYLGTFMNSMSIAGPVIEPLTVIDIIMTLKDKRVITAFSNTICVGEQKFDSHEAAILLNEYFRHLNQISTEKMAGYPPLVIPVEIYRTFMPGYVSGVLNFLCYILFPVDPEAKLVAVQEAYKQYAINVLKKLLGENDIFASTATDDFVFSPTFDYTMMSTQIKTEMAKLCLDKGYQLTPELPLVKGLGGTIVAKLNSTQLEALLLLLKDKGVKLTNRNRATIARLENVALAK